MTSVRDPVAQGAEPPVNGSPSVTERGTANSADYSPVVVYQAV